jgi:hypothetical protein
MQDKARSKADFSVRVSAVAALRDIAEGRDPEHDLSRLAENLDDISTNYDAVAAANAYGAYAGLLRIVDTLVKWRRAVLGAEQDADRFLRSAKER